MRSLVAALFIVACAFLPSQAFAKQAQRASGGQPVTDADIKAVIQAVQDEIYAANLQGDGYDAGLPDGSSAYKLEMYIQPVFSQQGLAWTIYKLMPYGEVLRMFWIRDDGTALLYGKPEGDLLPTGPSYLTAYMADDDLFHDKQTWNRTSFIVELQPSAARLREAAERQKKRLRDTATKISAADASAAYRDSQRAAKKAETEPDPTGGPSHYFLDYGQPLPIWAAHVRPVRTFGPFLKTMGSGAGAKTVRVKIAIVP